MLVSTDPSNDFAPIGQVAATRAEDLAKLVRAAHTSQSAWERLSVAKRGEYLKRFAEVAQTQKQELAAIISRETGRPIVSALGNVQSGLNYLTAYIDAADKALAPRVVYESAYERHTLHYEPWGVVACITPWNFPFLNVAWQCAQALLCGNAVIYKPSEETPLFASMIADIARQADLPAGVFTVLIGDGHLGRSLVQQNINALSFTGSTAVGQELTVLAAQKFIPIVTELGGSAPGIVFGDADIDKVLDSIFAARFTNAGQSCDALKRLIVHESIFAELTEKLKKLVESKKVGPAHSSQTDIGPLVSRRQLERLEYQVQDALDKGAVAITGGSRPVGLKGGYYLPTLLVNVRRDMLVLREETFGPVLPIISFAHDEEAIQMANDTDYGLGAYVYTTSKDRYLAVAAQLKTGNVAHNNALYYNPATPFGGYKKSGMGRSHGDAGFREMCQIKVVSEEL